VTTNAEEQPHQNNPVNQQPQTPQTGSSTQSTSVSNTEILKQNTPPKKSELKISQPSNFPKKEAILFWNSLEMLVGSERIVLNKQTTKDTFAKQPPAVRAAFLQIVRKFSITMFPEYNKISQSLNTD
jgi:hypothetical protein